MDIFKNSRWIAKFSYKRMSKDTDIESIMLRKTFDAKPSVKKATLYACGLGQAVYHMNGKRITDDVYVTHYTKYDSRVYYNTFDVTSLIKDGKNTIAAHLGNWFYNDCTESWSRTTATWRSQPKLLATLEIEYADGTYEYVYTDSTWKASLGPIVYNNMLSGEIYDARLLPENWDNENCDESAWDASLIAIPPGGVIESIKMPPVRVVRTITPEKIGPNLYDCGETISGRARIFVRGKSGDEVQIKYAEGLEDDGTLSERMNKFAPPGTKYEYLKHTDVYILNGEDTEDYAPEFVYHGFRYVQVSYGNAELTNIVFEDIHNDFDIIGEFECSDDMINEIHKASVRSTLANYLDIPTDCPHREQNGWTGDALISAQQSLLNFDIKDAYQKWMYDFKDAQRPTGQLPGIIPTASWGFNWGSGPAWDSAIIMIPYQVYQNTGDDSLIRSVWENIKRYIAYLESMHDDYIVKFGLGDWCPPHRDDSKCPSYVTNSGYFYADCQIAAKCAELLGEDGSYYEELAEKVKDSYRRHFLGDEKLMESQTFIACGIYWGFYNEDEIPEKAKALAQLVIDNDYHIDCGILGTKYIFTALSENGYADVLYKMVTNPTAPSYAFWINQGLKTFAEQWYIKSSMGVADSQCHHMFSEVDHWFYKYIGGIRLDETGLTIKPCFIESLDWAHAKHRDIEVSWNKETVTVTTDRCAKVILKDKVYNIEKGTHTFNIN